MSDASYPSTDDRDRLLAALAQRGRSLPAILAELGYTQAVEPPYNGEAEQAVLAGLLYDNRTVEGVRDILRPEDFADAVNGRIYRAILELTAAGIAADPVTLKNRFDRDGALADIGGAQYLARLAASVITIMNLPDYAEVIRDLAERRRIMAIARTMQEEAAAVAAGSTAAMVLDRAQSAILQADTGDQRHQATRLIGDYAREVIAEAEAAMKRGGDIVGIPTGLADLDRLTGGIHPTDLVILAGRPSMGKSALALTIAFNAARRGHPVLFSSQEMSGAQLAGRTLSKLLDLPSNVIREGRLDQRDMMRMVSAIGDPMDRLPLAINATGGLTIGRLRAMVQRFMLSLSRMPGRDVDAAPLVVVDYLQLMIGDRSARGAGNENRVQEISDITRGLKAMAKEFSVGVLALSQLSRAVEQREDKRPMLADLRESGSIEQDADVVQFVFREEYYLSRAEPQRRADETDVKYADRCDRWNALLEQVHNTGEVIIAKQRHGPIGKVTLRFNPQTTWFENLAR